MSHQKIRNSKVVVSQLRQDLPDFKVGSLVSVKYKIIEGDKERSQTFKGIVTNRHGGNSLDATFTVMKSTFGQVKVERSFPLHSPIVESITVELSQRARKANLNKLAFSLKDIVKSLRAKPFKPGKVSLPKLKTQEPATTKSQDDKSETPETKAETETPEAVSEKQ